MLFPLSWKDTCPVRSCEIICSTQLQHSTSWKDGHTSSVDKVIILDLHTSFIFFWAIWKWIIPWKGNPWIMGSRSYSKCLDLPPVDPQAVHYTTQVAFGGRGCAKWGPWSWLQWNDDTFLDREQNENSKFPKPSSTKWILNFCNFSRCWKVSSF